MEPIERHLMGLRMAKRLVGLFSIVTLLALL
jgi:hypothetical protein